MIIVSLNKEKKETCTTVSSTNTIYIAIQSLDTGSITGTITAEDSKTKISITSCDTTYTNTRRSLDDKVYTLTLLETNTPLTKFNVDDVANTKIQYLEESVGLGTQLSSQTITTEYTFIVVLADDNKSPPLINVENDENNKVTCLRTQSNLTELIYSLQPIGE